MVAPQSKQKSGPPSNRRTTTSFPTKPRTFPPHGTHGGANYIFDFPYNKQYDLQLFPPSPSYQLPMRTHPNIYKKQNNILPTAKNNKYHHKNNKKNKRNQQNKNRNRNKNKASPFFTFPDDLHSFHVDHSEIRTLDRLISTLVSIERQTKQTTDKILNQIATLKQNLHHQSNPEHFLQTAHKQTHLPTVVHQLHSQQKTFQNYLQFLHRNIFHLTIASANLPEPRSTTTNITKTSHPTKSSRKKNRISTLPKNTHYSPFPNHDSLNNHQKTTKKTKTRSHPCRSRVSTK